MQQFASFRQILTTPGISDQSVVTDAMKAAGQYMQQKAAHDFAGTERHDFVARCPFAAVVFSVKGHAALIQCKQSRIGYETNPRCANDSGDCAQFPIP